MRRNDRCRLVDEFEVERKVYSQHGEDGVIQWLIIRRIGDA